tara:strand:+ start:3611 stop:3805 length:195 start_codon:yes stop_codon:yes gene_type:complete
MPDKSNRNAIDQCVDTIIACQEEICCIVDTLDKVDGDVVVIKEDLKEILRLIKKKEERDMKKWW